MLTKTRSSAGQLDDEASVANGSGGGPSIDDGWGGGDGGEDGLAEDIEGVYDRCDDRLLEDPRGTHPQ